MHWTDKIILFGPFKTLTSMGTLRHSKIFVNHKCQSNNNKHYCLSAVAGKVTCDLSSHGLMVID